MGIPLAISSRDRALGTGIAAVKALAPSAASSARSVRCRRIPSAAATRPAASKLEAMPLAVVDRQGVQRPEAVGPGDCGGGGGIQSAR